MSPIEQRIIAHLETARGRLANAGEIRSATGAKSDLCIRVLVHRLRHLWGIEITSARGPFGGYQLTALSA